RGSSEGWRIVLSRDYRIASFETPAARAPQDDVLYLMPSKESRHPEEAPLRDAASRRFLRMRAPSRRTHEHSCSGSKGKAAVDDVDRAGRERGFVGGEIGGERRHLLGGAEPAQGLALDKGAARRLGAAGQEDALHRDALVERGRRDGAGADRVTADPLGNEIG